MYTVDYFINKFEKIPEEMWTIGQYGADEHCALGHCGMRPGALTYTYEGDKLFDLVYETLKISVTYINDGDTDHYQQPTPKKRILAALYDIKKLNSELPVQECDATKVKKVEEAGNIKVVTKYVGVPVSIGGSLPETILS